MSAITDSNARRPETWGEVRRLAPLLFTFAGAMTVVSALLALHFASRVSAEVDAPLLTVIIVGFIAASGLAAFLFLRSALRGVRRSDPVRSEERRPNEANRWIAALVGTIGLIGAAWLAQQPLTLQAILASVAAAFFAILVGAAAAILMIR